jgi:PAS domain S-box-containing protein
LIDLAGLQVGAREFLASVLEQVAQPIWVADAAGTIRFANPAALRALGYERAEELAGRDAHETIRGGSGTASEWLVRRLLATGRPLVEEPDQFVRSDGTAFRVTCTCTPIELPPGRGVVVMFASAEDRERLLMSPREPEALHRVATLVAEAPPPEALFAAMTREVGQLLGPDAVTVARYEPAGGATAVASWPPEGVPGLTADLIESQILQTARPVRIDPAGPAGLCAVGSPVIAGGRAWGSIVALSTVGPLPARTERVLAQFADLASTAIRNADAGAQLQRLANEQAALRRVATLVARESPPAEVFAAVAEEVGRLLAVEVTTMHRYDGEDAATVVASWGRSRGVLRVGERIPVDGENVTAIVHRTCKPARIDDYNAATGELAEVVRKRGVHAAVACPIVVDGRLWGAMVAAHRRPVPLPDGTESRIAQFTELIATAIANVQGRADLAASRARIVAAADDERRRVVRDLHDGAQQHLVHTLITLKMTRDALPGAGEGAPQLVRQALEQCQQAMKELRELAHGILPTVLTRGGLLASAESLADRMPVPVEVDVTVDRLPGPVEATAYFVFAEALTNVAKHAQAQRAGVSARVEGGTLELVVRDDGVGGARTRGSGLLGLADRVAALEGALRVESPDGGGTVVTASIPLAPHQAPPAQTSASFSG